MFASLTRAIMAQSNHSDDGISLWILTSKIWDSLLSIVYDEQKIFEMQDCNTVTVTTPVDVRSKLMTATDKDERVHQQQ